MIWTGFFDFQRQMPELGDNIEPLAMFLGENLDISATTIIWN